MEIAGYILIFLGAIGLVGNLSGGGGVGDPDPTRSGGRLIVHVILIGGGVLLAWMG